ncbi:actin [Acrasis kona]
MNYSSLYYHKICTDIKEKLCAVSLNYDVDRNTIQEREYMLPDRKTITISNEAFMCTEALFNPSMVGKHQEKTLGVHQAVLHVYNKCDDHIKKLLAKNIVLSGGSTMFEGMKNRLSKELNAAPALNNTQTLFNRAPNASAAVNTNHPTMKVKDPSERKFSCWIGGSILASLPTFQQLWIQRAEYEERGPKNIVFSKCF